MVSLEIIEWLEKQDLYGKTICTCNCCGIVYDLTLYCCILCPMQWNKWVHFLLCAEIIWGCHGEGQKDAEGRYVELVLSWYISTYTLTSKLLLSRSWCYFVIRIVLNNFYITGLCLIPDSSVDEKKWLCWINGCNPRTLRGQLHGCSVAIVHSKGGK